MVGRKDVSDLSAFDITVKRLKHQEAVVQQPHSCPRAGGNFKLLEPPHTDNTSGNSERATTKITA